MESSSTEKSTDTKVADFPITKLASLASLMSSALGMQGQTKGQLYAPGFRFRRALEQPR
jgi:hypothetical protein